VEYSKEFIDKINKGDRIAQRSLYESCSAKMYGVCLRYVSNPDIAKDILHDGFVKVFTSIKSFRGEGSFEGWVRRIIVNTALEYLRQSKDHLEVELDYANANAIDATNDGHDINFFLGIVAELPPQYRTVFNLYAIDDYTHSEIAEMLKISESTSKSNYSRARAILREKLEKVIDFKYEEFLR
jgi:RNA polymerase sigma factor (sigma-70 family)